MRQGQSSRRMCTRTRRRGSTSNGRDPGQRVGASSTRCCMNCVTKISNYLLARPESETAAAPDAAVGSASAPLPCLGGRHRYLESTRPAAGIPLYVTAVQARTRRESQPQACFSNEVVRQPWSGPSDRSITALSVRPATWMFDCRRANSYVKCPSIFSWPSFPPGAVTAVSRSRDEDQQL